MEVKTSLLLYVKHQVSSIQILHNEEQMFLLTSLMRHIVDLGPEGCSGKRKVSPRRASTLVWNVE